MSQRSATVPWKGNCGTDRGSRGCEEAMVLHALHWARIWCGWVSIPCQKSLCWHWLTCHWPLDVQRANIREFRLWVGEGSRSYYPSISPHVEHIGPPSSSKTTLWALAICLWKLGILLWWSCRGVGISHLVPQQQWFFSMLWLLGSHLHDSWLQWRTWWCYPYPRVLQSGLMKFEGWHRDSLHLVWLKCSGRWHWAQCCVCLGCAWCWTSTSKGIPCNSRALD